MLKGKIPSSTLRDPMGFARRLMSQAAPHQAPERAVSLGRVLWEGGVAEKLVVKEKEGFFLARTSF